MASIEVIKKVHYVGMWLEDVFSDDLINRVASRALADKGKGVKVTLSQMGLRLKRTRIFTENVSEFFPISSVRAVMRNPRLPQCVMFVLTDTRKKYKIIALKCSTEGEAIHLNNIFQQIMRDVSLKSQVKGVELKKRSDNGNWTLAHRTSHNANMHLAEIFSEHTNSNGHVNGHVPVLDKSKQDMPDASVALHTSYVKRNALNSSSSSSVPVTPRENNSDEKEDDDDTIVVQTQAFTFNDKDEYTIETEVEPYPSSPLSVSQQHSPTISYIPNNKDELKIDLHRTNELDMESVKGDLNSLTEEVRGLKNILQTMSVKDSVDGSQADFPYTLPSHPNPNIYAVPRIVRAPTKTYEAKIAVPRRTQQPDPWASHHRLSGSFVMPPSSARGSMRSQADNMSVKSGISAVSGVSGRRSMSYRMVPSGYFTGNKLTIERSIEDTYGRPIKRVGSAPQSRTVIPVQYHTVGRKKLKIYQPVDTQYMDVKL